MANEANIRKVVVRLRSGQDTQTKHMLHDADSGGKCCLGVSTECAIEDGVVLQKRVITENIGNGFDDDEANVYEYVYGLGLTEWGVLPRPVAEWMGFVDGDDYVDDNPILKLPVRYYYGKSESSAEDLDEDADGDGFIWHQASTMNDDFDFDFNTIADAFEYTYLGRTD